MIKSGLVSVTFRALRPKEIIDIVKRAGLSAIEWGGDVHVPHGDIKAAKEVGKMTLDAGLEVAGYGSYYRCAKAGNANVPAFEDVLKSALSLQTDTIRVWAGDKGSSAVGEEYIRAVTKDSKRIAEMAASEGVKIAFEHHANTLTDSINSTDSLLKAINHPNVFSYWQPSSHYLQEEIMPSLESVLPWLSNIHVYHWVMGQRLPLGEGKAEWAKYLKTASKAEGDRYALLEFVKDDSPEQFMADALTLNEILKLSAVNKK